MGNIWDAAKKSLPEPQKRKQRSAGEYLHAVIYDEPLGFHDKKGIPDRGKTRAMGVDSTSATTKEQKKSVRQRMGRREKKHPSPPEPKIRSPVKRKGLKKKTEPQVPGLDDQTEEEKHEKIPKSSQLNERVEQATKRTDKLEKALPIKKKGCCSNRY